MSRRSQGEGSVFQRADGRWVAVIDLGMRGGRRRRKTIYGRTRRETAGKLKVALRAQQDGRCRPAATARPWRSTSTGG